MFLDRGVTSVASLVLYSLPPSIKARQGLPGPPFVVALGLASTHRASGARENLSAVLPLRVLRRRRISGDPLSSPVGPA